MNLINELDQIVLAKDLPEHNLRVGDIGTVVLVHNGGEGYEIEFITLDGETLAVATLTSNEVRPIGSKEIAHARSIN